MDNASENAINTAIAAERERCAKIAEDIEDMYAYDGPTSGCGGQYSAGGAHAAQAITERIRSGVIAGTAAAQQRSRQNQIDQHREQATS